MNDLVILKCTRTCRDIKLKKLIKILNDNSELGKVRQIDAIEYAIDEALKNLKK